jgi:hypothetical protein
MMAELEAAFQGKTMAAIRRRVLARKPEPEGGELDDEIPF